MSREIKFRGYCEKDSEWREGFYVTDGDCHEILTRLECGTMYASQIDIDSLGQLTGLKDRNGVDIYEGDIVIGWCHDPAKTWEVKYYGGPYSCGFVGTDNPDCNPHIQVWYEGVEVVGNIYENPELLEK